ncbi:hypothetical protein NLJ89_g5647 [Agrocybe chaxingu]|uniref:Chromatin assembly factor 1 subunit A dimerization domain-containing protein n=1 Tax=Agrocybe chaxingu TaxID=84603 RepID=A0A9W8K0L9_9AGAR|nr:hypothetical protein NLJ89_g5647 [Agrocybe chaxingu]
MKRRLLDMSGTEASKATPEVPLPAEKKQEKTSIVELRNGKINFKQKPLSFEKQSETLQEIVSFRAMLEGRIGNKESPLTSFPEEHRPLIAKLAHESDKTLSALSKHIHQELLPTIDDEDESSASTISGALPINIVENAIKNILTRNNYGLDAPLGVKLPAAVCVWRWEVRSENWAWLPKNSREKAEARHAERIQAKEELKALFQALPQEARDVIIDPKKTSTKLPPKELNRPETTPNPDSNLDDAKSTPQSSKSQGKTKADEPENDKNDTPQGRSKRVQDPEKAVKEKERLEKKAARAEKERKAKDAQNKSQSIMAKFFSKPTRSTSAAKKLDTVVAGPSKVQSDFERVFKPFVLQKDKVLAPQNWFLAEKNRRRTALPSAPKTEVIVVDSDDEPDVEMQDPQPTEQELAAMSPQEHLSAILSSLPPTSVGPQFDRRRRTPAPFKTYHSVSVRDLMSQLSEAEIGGNDELVRDITDKLRDREFLPAKAFCFHEDSRPGYFGTWTRSSKIIGPRTPFAKDTLVFDYGYDSGEEWEEEPAGEDVAEDADDDDGDADEQDSDMDSWLVDDDEEPVDLSSLGRNSPPPLFDFPGPQPQPKRKAEDEQAKTSKKRKTVIPLVPFAKGPIWETTVGECLYDPFNPYAIQLFNDTPLSVDPFTFVSMCLEDHKTSLRAANSANAKNSTTEGTFAIPALPPRLTATPTINLNDASLNLPGTSITSKKAPIAPKSTFPEIYVDFLLNKITQLQASSITALVETIFQDLREHKVKKIAIEAKVREVGEKCREKKIWIVKPALPVGAHSNNNASWGLMTTQQSQS